MTAEREQVGVGVADSNNGKLGRVAATYRPVGAPGVLAGAAAGAPHADAAAGADLGSCPHECPLLPWGACYALGGHTAITARRARTATFNLFRWLLSLPRGAFVRHLVSGDLFLRDAPDESYIAAMHRGHRARPDLRGWAYTHGWRRLIAAAVNRPGVTVNASCETLADARAALAAGWPVVRVVDADTPQLVDNGDHWQRVCPFITHGVTCDRCMLCARPARAFRGLPLVVAFRPEGTATTRTAAAIADAEARGSAMAAD